MEEILEFQQKVYRNHNSKAVLMRNSARDARDRVVVRILHFQSFFKHGCEIRQ